MLKATAIACLVLLLANPAFAASDGAFGPTSSGTFTINASVGEPVDGVVALSGVDGLVITRAEVGAGRLDDICIYHTSPTVSVTATQIGGGPFRMIGPDGAEIALAGDLRDVNTNADGIFQSGVAVRGFVGNRNSVDCSDGRRQELVFFIENIPTTAPPGIYVANISLTIAVE